MDRDLWEFIEPESVKDIYIDGIARIEPIADGLLVRVWFYSEERLSESVKVIRARLVVPLGKALDLNAEAGKTYRHIHRATNPLKVVG